MAVLLASCLLLSSTVAAFGPNSLPFIASGSSSVPSLAWNTIKNHHAGCPSRLFQSSSSDGEAAPTPIELQETKYLQLAASSGEGVVSNPEIIYILMYNPGTTEEGVHTTEFPKGSGEEVMLAFESLEESYQFANMLREEPSFPLDPVPTPAPLAQMETACQQMGLTIKIVPAET